SPPPRGSSPGGDKLWQIYLN
nr:Chain A, Retro Trp-cage peptide [unidentified]